MAKRQLIVEVIGEERDLLRSFSKSSTAAKGFEHDIGRASKGAIAASLSFRGLGRSLAFASTSFIGGAGIAFAFKSIVQEASRVQEETEKTGVVFGKSAQQVQKWATTLSNSFGVSEGAALKASGTFGNMLRPLGFGEKAAAVMSERLVQLAADMASFNNTRPDVVLQALQSGLAGQVRPLRQFGVFLSQARLEEEALADGITKHKGVLTQAQKVQASYNIILKDSILQQGDVARNTESLSVAQSKFSASIQDLESRLGKQLLPVITQYLNKASTWLSQTKNQERIQRDLGNAADVLAQALHGLVDALKLVREVTAPLVESLGGMRRAVEVIALAATAAKIRGLALSFGLVATREKEAATNATLLGGRLSKLPGRIFISVIIATEITGPLKKLFEQAFGANFNQLTKGGGIFNQKAGTIVSQIDGRVVIIGPDHKQYTPAEYRDKFGAAAIARSLSETGAHGGAFSQAPVPKRTIKQITQANQFFDASIGRAQDRIQDIGNLQGQIGALGRIASLVQARLAKTKDVTRRLTLESKLADVFREIKNDRQQLAENFTGALEFQVTKAEATAGLKDDIAALDKLIANLKTRIKQEQDVADLQQRLFQAQQDRLQKQQQQRSAAQFKTLGLGPTGEKLIPTVPRLKKELGTITDLVSGTFLDTTKTRSVLANIAKVLTAGIGKVSSEVRAKIQEMLGDLDRQLKDHAKPGHETRARIVNTDAILAGIGLTPDQIRAAKAQLAHLTTTNAAGITRTIPRAALAGVSDAGSDTIVNVYVDGKKVETSVTKRQQKRTRRNPPRRRGGHR